MKEFKGIVPKAVTMFLIFTVVCGLIYTGIVTVCAQVLFGQQANGQTIVVDGKEYGSALLGQQYTDDSHMWGRIMNIDVSTFRDQDQKAVMYAYPSNLSPAGEEYEALVAQRIEKLQQADPGMAGTAIPVDLVTCSGSGLDPHISPAAARYQVARIARAASRSEQEVEDIIDKCTSGKLFGIFGEKSVNVLKVNLMLDGILK